MSKIRDDAKSYVVYLDNEEYVLMTLGELVIGWKGKPEINYEVMASKLLKFPVATLVTAAERLDKRLAVSNDTAHKEAEK